MTVSFGTDNPGTTELSAMAAAAPRSRSQHFAAGSAGEQARIAAVQRGPGGGGSFSTQAIAEAMPQGYGKRGEPLHWLQFTEQQQGTPAAEAAYRAAGAPWPVGKPGRPTVDYDAPNPDPSAALGGQQLQMFMTPNEIHRSHQVLDTDRASHAEEAAMGQPWERAGTSPVRENEGLVEHTADPAGPYYRSYRGGKYRPPTMPDFTDKDVWDAKLAETHEFGKHGQYGGFMNALLGRGDPYAHLQEGEDDDYERWDQPEETMYQSIQKKGVLAPAHLGTAIGSQGKPQVVGGHHRIAAQTDIDPTTPVPVQHHWDIYQAQLEGGYS